MAEVSPLELDPDEELWMQVDWSGIFEDAGEEITSSTWTPSAEATLDGHSSIGDEFTEQVTALKVTGGVLDAVYAWTHTVETLDARGRTRKRQRTILLSVKER